jgi:hypothetical protein
MRKSLLARLSEGQGGFFSQYIYNWGDVLSQVLSVALGGDPDETVSSRTGKAMEAGIWWFVHVQGPFINFLFQDPNHCTDSIEPEEGAKELWHWVKE